MNQKYLNQTLTAKIDRPFGSKHPKHGFIYPVNYGYIPNTTSGDGEELDCYILGVFEPVEEYERVRQQIAGYMIQILETHMWIDDTNSNINNFATPFN